MLRRAKGEPDALSEVTCVEVLDRNGAGTIVLNDLVLSMESTASNDVRNIAGASLLDGNGI